MDVRRFVRGSRGAARQMAREGPGRRAYRNDHAVTVDRDDGQLLGRRPALGHGATGGEQSTEKRKHTHRQHAVLPFLLRWSLVPPLRHDPRRRPYVADPGGGASNGGGCDCRVCDRPQPSLPNTRRSAARAASKEKCRCTLARPLSDSIFHNVASPWTRTTAAAKSAGVSATSTSSPARTCMPSTAGVVATTGRPWLIAMLTLPLTPAP